MILPICGRLNFCPQFLIHLRAHYVSTSLPNLLKGQSDFPNHLTLSLAMWLALWVDMLQPEAWNAFVLLSLVWYTAMRNACPTEILLLHPQSQNETCWLHHIPWVALVHDRWWVCETKLDSAWILEPELWDLEPGWNLEPTYQFSPVCMHPNHRPVITRINDYCFNSLSFGVVCYKVLLRQLLNDTLLQKQGTGNPRR